MLVHPSSYKDAQGNTVREVAAQPISNSMYQNGRKAKRVNCSKRTVSLANDFLR